jgi:hypothetical protein
MSKPDIKFRLSIDRLSKYDRQLIEDEPNRYKEVILSTPVHIIVEEKTIADMSFSELNRVIEGIEEKVNDPNLTEHGLEMELEQEFNKPINREKIKHALDKIRGRK